VVLLNLNPLVPIMEDIQLDEIPAGKVYKTGQIATATFFGGLFVGAYLLAENFKVLGNRRGIYGAWIIATVLFLASVALPFFIPVLAEISNWFYVAFFALLASWAGRHYQLEGVNAHIEKGGELHSTGRVVGVTLIGLGIVVALGLALFIIQDRFIGIL